MERDYYEVPDPEGRGSRDDQARVSRAFAHHPDVSGDLESEARFRELGGVCRSSPGPRRDGLYDGLGWRVGGAGASSCGRHAPITRTNGGSSRISRASSSRQGRGRPEREPTRSSPVFELDAYEAYLGATRRVELGEERPCDTCEGSGRRKAVAHHESGRLLSFDACEPCGGTGVGEDRRPVDVSVLPGARDSDVVAVGAEEVAIVRIVPPRSAPLSAPPSRASYALGFLLFLLAF